MFNAIPQSPHLWLLLGVLGGAAACRQPASPPPAQGPAPKAAPVDSKPVNLELNGFNYTDLYIDSFSVNGQSGGNLFVSSPTSGGGGSVCCVRWFPGGVQLPLTVSWTRDHKRVCEQEVHIRQPVPANPQHLGVHFFPDGHIEAELSEDFPELKLELEHHSVAERKASGNTHNDERLSRCTDSN